MIYLHPQPILRISAYLKRRPDDRLHHPPGLVHHSNVIAIECLRQLGLPRRSLVIRDVNYRHREINRIDRMAYFVQTAYMTKHDTRWPWEAE